MRITTQGWQRNHGETELLSRKLKVSDYRQEPGSLRMGDVQVTAADVRLIRNRQDRRVTIAFGAENVRMGGDYLTRVTVGRSDAALLFALAFRGVPFEDALQALADADRELRDLAEAEADPEAQAAE